MISGLPNRIRLLRKQTGLNQVQLGERLEVSKSCVNAWEAGTNSPSLLYVIRLAKIFGVTTDYLLGVSDDMTVDISQLGAAEREAVNVMVNLLKRKT